MNVRELNDALRGLMPGLNREHSVDRVIYGDPDLEIRSVAVCWLPSLSAIREAASFGANLAVTHEPTFYDHFEFRNGAPCSRLAEAISVKQALLDKLGMAVIRCHDVWDARKVDGIPFEWARFLGLGDPVRQEAYMHVYRVTEQSARDFARCIAIRTAAVGQATVGFYGDPSRQIRSVGIGTGCYSDALDLFDLGADLAITVDDITRSWIVGSYANDTGNPVVVVNHGVSEACAMSALAECVRGMVPGVAVKVVEQGVSFFEVISNR